jgi:hypothetical protein
MLPSWNWNQYKAAGKHVASYAAGGVSVAVAFHYLSPGQGDDITTNLNSIFDGIKEIAIGTGGLITVLTPIYTALRAARNASVPNQGASLVAAANNTASPDQAKMAQVAIASAVIEANDLVVNGTITAPAAVASEVPSTKIVTGGAG